MLRISVDISEQSLISLLRVTEGLKVVKVEQIDDNPADEGVQEGAVSQIALPFDEKPSEMVKNASEDVPPLEKIEEMLPGGENLNIPSDILLEKIEEES